MRGISLIRPKSHIEIPSHPDKYRERMTFFSFLRQPLNQLKAMGLDYTNGCVNFRDVGEYLELITGKALIPHGRLLRGGSIDHVNDWQDIGKPATLICLRKRADFEEFPAHYLHFPTDNKIEVYDTQLKQTRRWLNSVIRAFENPELRCPVLVHCLSGKDRTGVVIAALLLIMGVDWEVIIEEYLLSEGKVSKQRIEQAINRMMPLDWYFKGVDLEAIRGHFKQG